MSYDVHPMPERVFDLELVDGPTSIVRGMLSIGIQTITRDNNGITTEPKKAIVLAIGTNIDPEESKFSIDAQYARTLIKHLDKYARALET